MVEPRSAILQGTLDLMVLKTLEQMGPLHGYGIARRIEQIGEQALIVNQGTIYLCLVRLLQKRWISAKWGTSENNRKAKFYAITKAGRTQLKAETENWERISGVIGRVLQPGLPAEAPATAGLPAVTLATTGLAAVALAKAGS
jgi:transcriptional regulator